MRRTLTVAVVLVIGTVVCVSSAALLVSRVQSSQDLVLLRNALIAEVVPAVTLEWTPDAVPKDYLLETAHAPGRLQSFATKAARLATDGGEFPVAVALAKGLVREQRKAAEPIQSDTLTAFERISSEGAGYCADYTQVFNALGAAAGLVVREWGMSFRGYGGDGHAFSEVWDSRHRQWVFLDSFYSFYATDRDGNPLSVSELRDALMSDGGQHVVVVPISKEKFGFKTADQALAYYRRGAPRFYMVWGNNSLSYDAAPAVRAFARLSRGAEQLAAIAAGVQPRLVIPLESADASAIVELKRLRLLMLAFVMSAVATVVAALVLLWMRKQLSLRAA